MQSADWPWYVVVAGCASVISVAGMVFWLMSGRSAPESENAPEQVHATTSEQLTTGPYPKLTVEEMTLLAKMLSDTNTGLDDRKVAAEKLATQGEAAKPFVQAFRVGLANDDLVQACAVGLRNSKDESNETIRTLLESFSRCYRLKINQARRAANEGQQAIARWLVCASC